MARKRTPRLERARVAETALELLNEVGLEKLTLRRIAHRLDVQAPALYWHFAHKQELLDEMATVLTRRLVEDEENASPRPGQDWRSALVEANRLLRRHLLRYRDGAKVVGGTRLRTTGHARQQEAFLRVFVDAGFTPSAAARALSVAYTFTLGFVTEEQAVQPMPDERTPGYDPAERAARLVDTPLAAEVSADLFADYDSRFEEGLAAVVAGIAVTFLGAGE